MHVQLNRWGNNLGLRIPKALADRLRLRPGMRVEISAESEGFVVSVTHRLTLDDILDGVTPEAMHDAFDWGPDLGRENVE
jgi:antitoxin MazE